MFLTLPVSEKKWYLLPLMVGILVGLLAYWKLSKQVCLWCPIEIPLDYVSEDGIRTVADPNGKILLFRGVHAQHPDYQNAKIGVATPIGGHNDPYLHNNGDNRSVFTSWTNNIWTANKFANYKGIGGIILVKHFHLSEIVPSPDMYHQGEFLIRGVVTGAVPIPTFKTNKPLK